MLTKIGVMRTLGAAALVLGGATGAQADTLDFTEIGAAGVIGSTVIDLSNATLTSFGVAFFIGGPGGFGETNGLGIACGTAADGSCEADWQIDFATEVTDLMLSSFAAELGDSVVVSAFNGATLLTSVVVTTDTALDLTAFGAIDRLFFDDSSSESGIGFGDFLFNTAQVVTVPEPASLGILGAGLAGLGFAAWRRRSHGA